MGRDSVGACEIRGCGTGTSKVQMGWRLELKLLQWGLVR